MEWIKFHHLSNKQVNESKNMNKKNTIRLTESELKSIIIESVKNILKEEGNLPFFYVRPDDNEFNNEDSKKAYDLIEQHNSTITDTSGSYYIISVTGRKGCFYTLYLFSAPVAKFGKKNPYIYKGNLSQTFFTAVEKVLATGTYLPIKICEEDELLNKIKRYNSETFKSGKHQGKTYEEVYATDPRYILWYYDKLKEESKITKKNPYTGQKYSLSKAQQEMFDTLESYVKTYHEEQQALRRQTIDSVHEENDKITNITFTVTKVTPKTSSYGDNYVEMRGQNDNKYYLLYPTNLIGQRPEELKSLIGATVSITSAKTTPTEVYGVKYNKLSYVKGLTITQANN